MNLNHILRFKFKTTDKACFLVGNLSLNLIDYQSNTKLRDFVNLIFQHIGSRYPQT